MSRFHQPTCTVYRSAARRDCTERALVLQAIGIRNTVCREEGEYLLIVAEQDTDRAAAELEAYARENRNGEDRSTPPPERSHGWNGVFAYAGVLLLIAILQNRSAFSSDWFAVGNTHAGLVRHGEWWRTVTALSLHLDFVHLVSNLVIGGLFGLYVARLLGSGLAWASILATGAVGNTMNAWIQPADHSAVGASTAVFGALGILSSYSLKTRHGNQGGWIRRWAPVVGGVALLALTGTGGERTDIMAHVTGFLSGLILGGLYRAIGQEIHMSARTQFALGSGALSLLAVCWLIALRAQG
ncbi:MAG: rhomboid family intramembrane serine protease [Phycisphaerae bacterium]